MLVDDRGGQQWMRSPRVKLPVPQDVAIGASASAGSAASKADVHELLGEELGRLGIKHAGNIAAAPTAIGQTPSFHRATFSAERVGTVNASTAGGREALAGALALGRSAIGPVRTFAVADCASRLAAATLPFAS